MKVFDHPLEIGFHAHDPMVRMYKKRLDPEAVNFGSSSAGELNRL